MSRYPYHITLLLLSMLLMSAGRGWAQASLMATGLRCEQRTDPSGIDTRLPRLSWQLQGDQRGLLQTAYQVLVASSPEKLGKGMGDLWNSGKVASDQSIMVRYRGALLKSRMACYWKVRVWTTAGESSWSRTGRWSMGLLEGGDWQARWIGYEHGFPWDSVSKFSRLSARYFRREFQAGQAIKKATLYIIGLGHYEAYINGEKIGDQVLAEAPTDYTQSVKYNTFDVTAACRGGMNALGVVVGNGRYFTMRPQYKPKKIKEFGYPKLLLQLEIEYANGSRQRIVSDDSWKFTADGPIRSNNEYDGEEYDATRELTGWNRPGYDDDKWLKPQLVGAPGGRIGAQMNEPIKVKALVTPIGLVEQKPGTWILDMGQNMAGWVQLKARGQRGNKVILRFGETLQKDGALYTANLRDAKVTDVYTLKGEGEEIWHPVFVFHGFRYVEINGYPGKPAIDDFEGQVVYDDLATIGEFRTSNPLINQVYQNAYWGILSNYKGMPLDCPQRNERMPWLGDRAAGALGESYIFDNESLYAKWLDDIGEAQKPDGSLPDVAPAYWNYYSDNMTWPGTYILIADMLYRQFGDIGPIEKHYASMKKWLDYMRLKYAKDDLMTKDKYGDWCVPPESPELIHSRDSSRNTNGQLIATAYYYHLLMLIHDFAGLLKKGPDEERFLALAQRVKRTFNAKYLDSRTFRYDNNTVTANLLPLYFGMAPEPYRRTVFGNMVTVIEKGNNSHISTGVIGSQWLMRGLTDYGRPDLAYRIASNSDYPSWGYMVRQGATTIWELWNGNTADPAMNSHNHIMLLGDLITWFYRDLAGISAGEPGYKTIILKPAFPDSLSEVSGSFRTPYGVVKSAWKWQDNKINWAITIPGNTRAQVFFPADDGGPITEDGWKLADIKAARVIRKEKGRVLVELGSGTYSFTVLTGMGKETASSQRASTEPVQQEPERRGIIGDEFIFDKAPYPECHAATIAETKEGLVAAWFGGTKERNPDVCIWVSRRDKGAARWTEAIQVADGIQDTLRYACWNPVLYQVPGGELLLFYKVGPSPSKWKGWLIRSRDGGISWSRPQALPEGFLGPIKNKPVLLSDGELICPSSTEGNGWKVHFELTADAGKTWKMAGPVPGPYQGIQPSILFYKDGSLQALCRSQNRAILASWSNDNGKSWSPLAPIGLPNNNSGTDAVTLADGRQLLVYNHVLPPAGQAKGARSPLNVALSPDGKEWYAALVLEKDTLGQYSYPSVIQSADGIVHIVYTWRREKIKHVAIDPSKLVLKKIERGEWPDLSKK